MKRPSMELKPLAKNSIITLGSLALIVLGACAVAGFISWEEGKMKTVVKETMAAREMLSADAAHPDLAKHYVSKRELNGSLHRIQRHVDRIEIQNKAAHQQILERLPKTRHWSRIDHDLRERRRRSRR